MKVSVLTLLPEALVWLRGYSMIGRAVEKSTLGLDIIQIRDFMNNKYKEVGDYSFGGGPGMVMSPWPLFDMIISLSDRPRVYYLSPRGRVLGQEKLFLMKEERNIVLLDGHYKGIDQRVIGELMDGEISTGNYVLSSGEITNLVIIDRISRLLGEVSGSKKSYINGSYMGGFLELPQYTRPVNFRGLKILDVLFSGCHGKVEDCRLYQRMRGALLRRPGIFGKISLDEEEERAYKQIKNDLKRGGQSDQWTSSGT